MAGPPPLHGIKVIEFAGLAPGPFAGMLLADAGASVLRIDRPSPSSASHTLGGLALPTPDMLARHKTSLAVNLKDPRGAALIRRLATSADVLIDPFRPGVLERLGLGPETLCKANPRLIYARMAGFRRDGRYRDMAGHDINYLAVSGTLSLLGRKGEKPHPPWNILADFAGGGAMLFQGVLLAVVARAASGKGQVVEANMVDGASYLATFPRVALKTSLGDRPRGENLLDGGCPWYDTYETSDGGFMAVGALEPQFFAALMTGLGLGERGWEDARGDESRWPELRGELERVFAARTRAEWEAVFDGTDACCTPVLTYAELESGAAAAAGGQEGKKREGDQRPAVTLRETPCLAVRRGAGAEDAGRFGQGGGVEGDGYEGTVLAPGAGGEGVLGDWLGWERGREYEVKEGGLVWRGEASKL